MRFVHFAAPIVLVLVTATPVRAEDPRTAAPTQERARDVYAQGVKLHKQGDHLRAAQAFARADEIAPTPVALRAALDEALLAEDPVLAMTLAERTARAPNDAALRERAAAVRARFAEKTGRVNITCAGSPRCLATIDGASSGAGSHWVRTGQHTIVAQIGDEAQQKLVDVHPGETVDVAFKPKPATPPPIAGAPPDATGASGSSSAPATPALPSTDDRTAANADASRARGGVSPVFFFVGAALTAGAGAATILSGLDTRSLHDDFVNRQCDAFHAAGCGDLSVRGTNARTRTNVLAAATGVVGVATAVVGLFFVRWSGSSPTAKHTARLVPTLGGAALHGSF